MWDVFKCIKLSPEVPRAIILVRTITKPPTVVRIFFINPHPACCETEKGGEGERDTDSKVKGCLYLLTRQVERGAKESPPPDTLLLTSLRLQRTFSRKASNLEVRSMMSDNGK